MKNLGHFSDDVLLKLISLDDESAFEELFDRYWESAHCQVFLKLKSKEQAQEIVHDLFLNFWERRHSLEITSFTNYLHVSVKYKVLACIKQQLSQKKHFENYREQVPLAEEETLRRVEYNDLVKALEQGVKVLPERTQEVFRLNRLEGRSVSEIAGLLNLSEKAIEYHITRSRKELRLLLKDFLVLIFVAVPFFF